MKKLSIKKLSAMLLALLLVMTAFVGCAEKPADESGVPVTVTVDIVKDGDTKTVTLETDEKYLANALADEGIITYDEGGFYTTVNGITADYDADGAWWCVTKSGEMTMVGMNELELADGDKYEITYTK